MHRSFNIDEHLTDEPALTAGVPIRKPSVRIHVRIVTVKTAQDGRSTGWELTR